MRNVPQIHEEIFELLYSWSEKAKNELEINPFFYMRQKRDHRFKKGYWFPGNDSEYISISFWTGRDSYNKTPNVYFEIGEKNGCRLIIISKDSEIKHIYFSELVKYLSTKSDDPFIPIPRNNLWVKNLSLQFIDWKILLIKFLNSDKRTIDSYLSDNQIQEYEKFVSPFGFIDKTDFESSLKKVFNERKSLYGNNDNQNELIHYPDLALISIKISNFFGIIDAKIDDLNPKARWIFITGNNGYGKTSFLQAIAVGLTRGLLKHPDSEYIIQYKTTKEDRIRSAGTSEISSYSKYILGYGPARLNIQATSSENLEDISQNPILSLFDYSTLLRNVNYELFASYHTDPGAFQHLKNIIFQVTNGRICDIQVSGRNITFKEKLENLDEVEPMPLDKLASGFRNIINLAFDIYSRLKSVHEKDLYYGDYFGIVLIDEFENHLHPIFQRKLPVLLSKVFPRVQFIVSTHSPIPLLAAEKTSIIIKVNRTSKEGITLERLDDKINISDLLPNILLTSPIFGFEDIYPDSKDDTVFPRTEDTFKEAKENDLQNQQITSFFDRKKTDEILNNLKGSANA